MRDRALYLSDLRYVARADAAVDFDVQVGKETPQARNLLHHVPHELLPAEALIEYILNLKIQRELVLYTKTSNSVPVQQS